MKSVIFTFNEYSINYFTENINELKNNKYSV